MKPRTRKPAAPTLFSVLDLDLARLNLSAKRQPNGAIYVTGELEALRQLSDECARTRQWYPSIETRYTIEGETRTVLEGFPRISVHPQVAHRVDLGVQEMQL